MTNRLEHVAYLGFGDALRSLHWQLHHRRPSTGRNMQEALGRSFTELLDDDGDGAAGFPVPA